MSPSPKLVYMLACVAFGAIVAGVTALFNPDPITWAMAGAMSAQVPAFALIGYLDRWERQATLGQLAPVTRVVRACGPMPRRERQFQITLLNKIARNIEFGVKPEFPLPSGTRVDGWFRHDGNDWYITIKRGLDNQQRLTLQGEIEDILLHARADGRRKFWIVVVIGYRREWPPTFRAQMVALARYVGRRSVQSGVDIHVVPVPQALAQAEGCVVGNAPSCPLEVGTAARSE